MNTKATDVIEAVDSGYPLIEYSVTDAVLAELTEKYAGITEITDDNYELVKIGVQKMTKLRTGIETHRNELLKDARQFTDDVNAEAKRVTALVAAIESPVKLLKTDHDSKVKAQKEREKAKEKRRTDGINEKIDHIEQVGRDLDGLSAKALSDLKGVMENLIPEEADYQEFHAVALERHESTLARLTVAHLKAVARELEAQKLKEDQDRLAKEKSDAAAAQKVIDDANTAAQKKLDDDRAEFEAEKKARDDADALAASDEQAETDRLAQVERDAAIAEEAASDALAAKELEDSQAEEAEAERRELAPDREKLAVYAALIESVSEEAPTLGHAKAQKLLARAVSDLQAIARNLAEQVPKL
jgi:uncharacterized protein YoxC